jgi:hypothetical protein
MARARPRTRSRPGIAPVADGGRYGAGPRAYRRDPHGAHVQAPADREHRVH